ncbi:hypothetical protein EJ04DRAFT_581660 [Polyplosphaeria fusca]|uniref:Uncharacterized protein n=1 Tax=Polyplosphaeria fusca TaxID=682080 RepID=A0A9P4UWN3_9PLEO|nr:hypothetical protein EJ04DRAFT_581660 [Polyplosphaeria fusca]
MKVAPSRQRPRCEALPKAHQSAPPRHHRQNTLPAVTTQATHLTQSLLLARFLRAYSSSAFPNRLPLPLRSSHPNVAGNTFIMKALNFALIAGILAVVAVVGVAVPTVLVPRHGDVDSSHPLIRAQPTDVTIVMGNTLVNVADRTGPWLYGTVWAALDSITKAMAEGNPSIDHFNYDQQVYRDGGLHPDTLRIDVIGGTWDNNDQLRKLMIGSIAAAAQWSTMDKKNCFDWTADGKKGTHCAMGGAITVDAGPYYLTARFSSENQVGTFDCIAPVAKISEVLNDLVPEYQKTLKASSIELIVWCPDNQVTHGDKVKKDVLQARDFPVSLLVNLGNKVTNVGNHTGSPFYDLVWKALEVITHGKKQINTPSKFRDRPNSRSFPQQYYKKDSLFKDQFTVTVEEGYFDTDEIRKLLIGSVAAAAEKSSTDAKNCYKWQLPNGGGNGTFCSIGDTVTVRIGRWYMNVRFSAAAIGTFDCVAVVEATKKSIDKLIPEYNAALGVEAYSVVACTNVAVTHGVMGIDGKPTGELDECGQLTEDANGVPYPI